MDSMLKRVKALTETLSSLRRYLAPSLQNKTVYFQINFDFFFFYFNRHLSESTTSARSTQVDPLRVLDQGLSNTQNPCSSPKPQPRYSIRSPLPTAFLPMSQDDDVFSEAHRLRSTAVSEFQLYQHPYNFPLTHEQDSPIGAKVPQNNLRLVKEWHLGLLTTSLIIQFGFVHYLRCLFMLVF